MTQSYYLAWRVSNIKHLKIILSFLPVGHMKFKCNWAFTLHKNKFRVTHISSISEFLEAMAEFRLTIKVNSAVAAETFISGECCFYK